MPEQANCLSVTPVHPHFGARVEGVDLPRLTDESVLQQIRDALDEHSVLLFSEQRFEDKQQMEFSKRCFGPLEEQVKSGGTEAKLHPNLADWTNIDPEREGRLLDWSDRRMVYQSGNQLWHSDSSYKPVPAMVSLLSAREVPPTGGETQFASMRHAYATLPEETRGRVDGLRVIHSLLYQRSTVSSGLFTDEQASEIPPVRQALVRANPVNGRKSLFIGSHAWYIEGMAYDESRRLLDGLLAHTTRPECVYEHQWRPWDLVIWDNRCVLHRGRTWDAARHRRVMRRTTVAGDGPTTDAPWAPRTPEWDGIMPADVGL